MKASIFQFTRDGGWSDHLPGLDSPQTLVVVFGAPSYIDDPGTGLSDIATAFPTSVVMGCSGAGEIFGTQVADETLSVAVIQFDAAELRITEAPCDDPGESAFAGRAVATALSTPELRAVFVLSEGLNVNGSELVRGMNETFDEAVIVTGGLAGDNDRFERTWVLSDNQLKTNHVVAVGFYGDSVRIGHGSKGGWDIFGPERVVTRSEGNVLYELDGRPALELYKEYLGGLAEELPASGLLFPLAIRGADEAPDDRLVRTILAVDEEAQSLTFAGDIPEGSLSQLMRANFDRVIGGAEAAAEAAALNQSGQVVCLSISCVGRRLVLGERIEEEVEAVLDVMPPDTLQVGFYSYGELSPFASGACDLHNQTMTLTTIAED
ncbi:MAG: FIST C-terminal domain-containing protein [Acidimicrobiia bacterium]|nr:FIST C-terminal domain-containing protein [Acidimicrobiia bacterium]